MKRFLLLFALLLSSTSASAGNIASYPNAAPLQGQERLVATQNSTTVNITPAQLETYICSVVPTACGNAGVPGGPTGSIQFNNSGSFGGIATTGIGNVVLNNSPSLTTPSLGTPTSLILTNATGLPLSTGVTGTLGCSSLTGSPCESLPAPSNTATLWQSQSVLTLQASSALADRATMLTGTAGGFESGFAQEPSVFWNPTAGNWGMVYGGSIGLGYATAPAPNGPWTRQGKILGGGTGGFASQVAHARAIVVGGLIYITFPDNANNEFRITNGAAMPAANAAPVFSSNQVVFAPNISSLGITANTFGNSRLLQVGGTYYFFWEAFKTGIGWQIGTATCTSSCLSGGTYTLGIYPFTTLNPTGTANTVFTAGGPFPMYENGTYVLYYHGGGTSNTQIYRAFNTSATTDTWTIDNGGQPWLNPQLPAEVSQVADIDIVPSAGGTSYYAYWDGINNNASSPVNGVIDYEPIIEPVFHYDANATFWAQAAGMPKTTPQEFNYINGTPYTANATLSNHELGAFDPTTAAANLTATLPYADVGARVRVCNASTSGSYTLTEATQGTDGITAGAVTLGDGQCATFYSFVVNNWTREFGLTNTGSNNLPSNFALVFNGGGIFAYSGTYIDMEPGSNFQLVTSGGGSTTFAMAATSTNYTTTFPANTGTLAETNLAQTWSATQTFGTLYSTNGTAATISGCGTAGTIRGNGTTGTFVVGTGASTCTFTITPGLTATTGWVATVFDVTAKLACIPNGTIASTTTGVALCNSTVTTGDLITFHLSPF